MLKLFAIMLVVLSVTAGILGPQMLFVVDETQLAIVTRFGEIKQTIKRPGLYAKTPFVDSITYYDKRLLIFGRSPDSLLTRTRSD